MKKIWLILITALIFRVVLSFLTRHPDLNNHMDWGIRFWQYGSAKFYAPETNIWSYTWPNQPPGTIYMFAGIRKLYEAIFSGFWWINVNVPIFPSGIITFLEVSLYPALLKLPSILSDLGIAYILFKWTGKRLAAILWLVNPVVWYNSAVWGQTDAIVNFFVLLSFYLLLQKKITFSLLAFALSLYVKASLFIFLPVFAIVALRQKHKIRDWAVAALTSIGVIAVLTLPFSSGNVVTWLYDLYTKKVFIQQLHLITANAFNLWSALTGIHERPDSLLFLGLTYKYWSYIIYSLFYLPLLWVAYKKHDKSTIAWVLALTAFASFALLTNMHERYLYPLFPYLTILVASSSVSLFIYSAVSLISLLNLYNFWWVPEIELIKGFLSFGDRLMPRILGLVNFGIFIAMYSKFLRLNLPKKLYSKG